LFGIIYVDNTLLLKGGGGHFSKVFKKSQKGTFQKKVTVTSYGGRER
jgi:hypothetical protein